MDSVSLSGREVENMDDKLRRFVEAQFPGTVSSDEAEWLKEEMFEDLKDKYDTLISGGAQPETAYNTVTSAVNVRGGLDKIEQGSVTEKLNIKAIEAARRKFALMLAIAIMVYVISVLPIVMLTMAENENANQIGIPVLLILGGGASAFLIYFHLTKPRYYNYSKDSYKLIEGFADWQNRINKRKVIRRAITILLWTLVVALYLVFSFLTFAWNITWVIFIIGAAIEALVNLVFALSITLRS